jgi:hypothetical protein
VLILFGLLPLETEVLFSPIQHLATFRRLWCTVAGSSKGLGD